MIPATRARKNGCVGQVLKRLRRKARIKQATIAAELDITQSTYSKIEAGDISLTTSRANTICDLIKADIGEVMRAARELEMRTA